MRNVKLFCFGLALAASLGMTAKVRADEGGITNSTQAILQRPSFREGLVWIGPVAPSETESASLWQILQNLDKPAWTTNVEQFLLVNPASPWAASLHHAYASFCRRTGRTSKALEHWEAGWQLVKNDTGGAGRRVGGEILANWAEQLSSLGRREKLKALLPAGNQWPFANHQDREKFQAAKNNYFLMGSHPEMSFRCGTLALKAVGQVLQPTNQNLETLVDIPSPTNGFSIAALTRFASRYGLDLVAARRVQGKDLIVPSVIHWRQNHYAAILDQKDGSYFVNDPTFGEPKWLAANAINEEASSVFLIPASLLNSNWEALAPSELESIRGKGLPNHVNDGKDKGCTFGPWGLSHCDCTGMPVWRVSEPYINLWIEDEPMSYLTSRGEAFKFRLSFKQRDTRPQVTSSQGGGVADTGWNMSWFSYIRLVSTTVSAGTSSPNYPAWSGSPATLYLGDGGEVNFAAGQPYDQETRLRLNSQISQGAGGDDGKNGLVVIHADGSQDIYGYGIASANVTGDFNFINYMLTRHIDPHGNVTSVFYTSAGFGQALPQYIVDYDNHTNTLSYGLLTGTNLGGLAVLTNIAGPYGQSVQMKYDTSTGDLTNIVDAQGLSSSLTYDTNGYPKSLTTPYGTNQFILYVNPGLTTDGSGDGNFGLMAAVDRAVQVVDAIGGTHLYLYRYGSLSYMATNFTTGDVPTGTPLGTLDAGTGSTNALSAVAYRNSFSWNARQYASLSTTNFTSLTTNDFLRGRMKHWLQDTNDLSLSGHLSVERDPSPDGTTEGLKTFYDYQGKTYPYRSGTNARPSVVAWRLPGGETHYEYFQYDYFGNVTNDTTTCTRDDGAAVVTRNTQYVYADNTYTNVYGTVSGTNLTQIFTNTFTVPNLLKQVIDAYGSNAWAYGGFDPVTWNYTFLLNTSTNVTQTNQLRLSSLRVLPHYATNAVNEATTFTFTGFDKIATVKSPAGLTRSNQYDANGFLTNTTDIEIKRTNAFAYSTNGLPSVHTNELGLVTHLYWDNLLRLTGITFPDTTSISNTYSRLDLSGQKDRLGNWTHFGYDGLRHLTTITNANNYVTSLSWCDCGALTSISDPLNNTNTFTYDFQERLTGISFPDSSSMTYQFDLSGRRTRAQDGTGRYVQFTYNNQGNLTKASNAYGTVLQFVFIDKLDRPGGIIDADNVTAYLGYDELGRLIERDWSDASEYFVYATNGLISYTDKNGLTTSYGRDAARRLISITNPNIPSQVTQFLYDPANHLTNLIDGLNRTTTWNYNQYGWLSNKVDATNREVFHYAYDANGRLTNRWMIPTNNTGYAYDAVGNLTNIVYSNAPTTAIGYAYDAANRLTSMKDAVGTSQFGYTQIGQLASEMGPWTSNTVTYGYTQRHRTSLSLLQPTGVAWQQTNAYDTAWRMTGLSSPAGAFTYGYPASASALIQSLALPNAASINYQYDELARLTNTSMANYWGQVLDGYGYGYDFVGQRTSLSRYLGITTNNVLAGYDNIGQLTSWNASETNGAARWNEQLGYGYDAANNLQLRTNGALVQTFSVDNLNQLATFTRAGTLTESGATPAPATSVTVNGNGAQTYGDFTFARTNLTLVNGSNTFTNIAHNAYGVAVTNIVSVNLPASVAFVYDANGNLTSDGTRTFVYDAENQLTNVSVAGQWKTEYVYDGLRRKRLTRDYNWQSGSWVKTNETRYVYDRMLAIQERDSNNVVQVTYTRGLDVSLTLQGDGGIGGLLARTDANGSTFFHSDGSGNITALLDGNQNIVARYEYDPFGKLIGKWGPLADANVYRFSSKEFQRTSGLYAYGYRFYEPNLQRWINRDPIQEAGGINLYRAMLNAPLNVFDLDGFSTGNFYAGSSPGFNPAGGVDNAPPALTFSAPATGGATDMQYDGGGFGDPLTLGATGIMTAAVAGAAYEAGYGGFLLRQLLDKLLNKSNCPYKVNRPLPRDPESGEPIPDPEANGAAHTQLGEQTGRNGNYPQAREFNADGKPVRDIDFTDHGRPDVAGHTNPHEHPYLPNPTGGTPQRGPANALK